MPDNKHITCELLEHIGVISYSGGWKKELNIISWNGKAAKFDIRDWSDDHKHRSRGITLTDYELGSLVNIYIGMKNNLIWDEAAKKEEENRLKNEDSYKRWETEENPEKEKAELAAYEGAIPPVDELCEGEELEEETDAAGGFGLIEEVENNAGSF